MEWHFPIIFDGKDQTDEFLIIKVLQELGEFGRDIDKEHKAMEALDVLHAAESLVLKFFARNPELNFAELKEKVISKNQQRGYYVRSVPDVTKAPWKQEE